MLSKKEVKMRIIQAVNHVPMIYFYFNGICYVSCLYDFHEVNIKDLGKYDFIEIERQFNGITLAKEMPTFNRECVVTFDNTCPTSKVIQNVYKNTLFGGVNITNNINI